MVEAKVRIRMNQSDAHYGGNLVDGARLLGLFGDVATEILIRHDGDEGLFVAYDNVEFMAPVYAGDYIEAVGKLEKVGNTSRKMVFEAFKVIEAGTDPNRPYVARVLDTPVAVCRASGTCVVPKDRWWAFKLRDYFTDKVAVLVDKCIITAALVGAEVMKEDTPHLPVTPEEIGEAAEAACAAGASIAHIHVRDAKGNPSQDRETYRRAIEEIKKRCNIIIQVSTGGAVGMSAQERLQPISLRPEMATLTTGTVNFGQDVFMNSPEQLVSFAEEFTTYGVCPEFEIFEVGMIENALRLVKMGYFSDHLHFDFVLGVPGALPARAEHLLHMIRQLPVDATWSVAATGRFQLPMSTLAMVLGGHVRVGLEDNIYYTKGVLATNAQLVERVVRIAHELQRDVAAPDEARVMLGLGVKQKFDLVK